MNNAIWLLLVLVTILLWASSSLLCKLGVRDGKEAHICLKNSICAGTVFAVIALAYLMMRDEPFTIWESAVRYWPMTLFGIAYPIICTITFQGYLYNEVTVESPVEGISGGTSTILLILVYLVLGRVDSISELLTPLRTEGILLIMVSVALLAAARNRSLRENAPGQAAGWMKRGLGTLVFPVIYSVMDGLETIVTGVCLDTTYGYAMPEGDGIIIVGMEYAFFALGFWIYIYQKERKPYHPFSRRSAPLMFAALTDNLGIVCYSYAMAMNSVDILKEVVRYSIIDSSSYLFLGGFTGALNAFVSAQFGSEYLILVSAIVLSRELQLLFDGIGVAVGPIFSVYIGEENHSGLRSTFALARKTAIAEGIAVMLVLLAVAPLVLLVLHVEEAELSRWIVAGIRLTALGTTFVSLLYLLTSYYLVIGQILLGVAVCALRDVVLSVCLAVGLGKVLGVWGFFIGLTLAPMLAYALLMLYLTARYGKKDCPLLLSKVPGNEDSYLYNFSTEPEEIIGVQRQVETLLKEHDVDKRIVSQTMLLIEEAYMLIRQMNNDKAVLAECTVSLKPEGVQIIRRAILRLDVEAKVRDPRPFFTQRKSAFAASSRAETSVSLSWYCTQTTILSGDKMTWQIW